MMTQAGLNEADFQVDRNELVVQTSRIHGSL